MKKKLISILTMCVLVLSLAAVSMVGTFAAENESEPTKIFGDADSDGIITIVDATTVQKYIVSLIDPTAVDQQIADVDGDGIVTIMDATAIQKYIVGLDGYGKTGQPFVAE